MEKRLLQLFLLVIMALALVSFGAIEIPLNNLGDLNVDVAFQLALPYFFEQKLQFGEQVVFTYGPWGILLTAFLSPNTLTVVLLFRIALVICVFLALGNLPNRDSDRHSRIVFLSGAVGMVLLWMTGQRDSYLLFPALFVAYQRFLAVVATQHITKSERSIDPLLSIALTLLAGWAALAKFNIFVVSTVAFLLILIDDLKRRNWPLLPATYVVAILVGWLGADQSLVNLPLWVLRCLDLSNGYADAMAKGFFIPYSAGLVAIYYMAVSLIIFSSFAVAALHSWSSSAVLSLIFTLFVCAVSIKHGMGGNQIEQSLAVLVAVLWFVCQLLFISPAPNGAPGIKPWRRFGLTAAITALVFLAMVGAKTNFPIVGPHQIVADIRGNFSLMVNTMRGIPNDTWNGTLARVHRFWASPTVPTKQTIDVYPHYTGLVIGREGLRYVPRPAFLSLNAHTFKLALLNAGHLEGISAPDLLLFQVLPKERKVNNRHPALADGPSWPLLLSQYVPEHADDEFLLLKKRDLKLHIDRQLLIEADLKMGERLVLPHGASNLLWAEVDISRSAAGELLHVIYKSPHVLLESHMADNATHSFQIIPALGKVGFVMSPLVQNNAAFARLYQRESLPGDIVKSIIMSSPEAPAFFWKSTFKIKLYNLKVDLRP